MQSQSLWCQRPGNKVIEQSYCHSIFHRLHARHWAQYSACAVSPRILTQITLRDQGCDRCHPSLEIRGSERSGGLSMVTQPVQGKPRQNTLSLTQGHSAAHRRASTQPHMMWRSEAGVWRIQAPNSLYFSSLCGYLHHEGPE